MPLTHCESGQIQFFMTVFKGEIYKGKSYPLKNVTFFGRINLYFAPMKNKKYFQNYRNKYFPILFPKNRTCKVTFSVII